MSTKRTRHGSHMVPRLSETMPALTRPFADSCRRYGQFGFPATRRFLPLVVVVGTVLLSACAEDATRFGSTDFRDGHFMAVELLEPKTLERINGTDVTVYGHLRKPGGPPGGGPPGTGGPKAVDHWLVPDAEMVQAPFSEPVLDRIAVRIVIVDDELWNLSNCVGQFVRLTGTIGLSETGFPQVIVTDADPIIVYKNDSWDYCSAVPN